VKKLGKQARDQIASMEKVEDGAQGLL